jgi:hypothetical protein
MGFIQTETPFVLTQLLAVLLLKPDIQISDITSQIPWLQPRSMLFPHSMIPTLLLHALVSPAIAPKPGVCVLSIPRMCLFMVLVTILSSTTTTLVSHVR